MRLGWQISWYVHVSEKEDYLHCADNFSEGVYKLRCSSRPVTMVFIATLVP